MKYRHFYLISLLLVLTLWLGPTVYMADSGFYKSIESPALRSYELVQPAISDQSPLEKLKKLFDTSNSAVTLIIGLINAGVLVRQLKEKKKRK